MEESVFIEQAVEHASVDLLLLLDFRLFESLHDLNQLCYFGVHLVRVCGEHSLEVVISSIVDFF
jgi:hypothetical protein